MTAREIADNYNSRNGITVLSWDAHSSTWRMMHSGAETKHAYTSDELIEVGTRMGWDK